VPSRRRGDKAITEEMRQCHQGEEETRPSRRRGCTAIKEKRRQGQQGEKKKKESHEMTVFKSGLVYRNELFSLILAFYSNFNFSL